MARLKLFVDECLSVRLVAAAHARGYEAYHVVYRGLAGAKDHQLRPVLLREDAVLVTNNAKDFRRLYGDVDLHPGLIILVPNVPYRLQVELFQLALAAAAGVDMVNHVIEVHDSADVRVYLWPAP